MAVVTVAYSDLSDWLFDQPQNTPDTPYELNITGLTAVNLGSSESDYTLGHKLNSIYNRNRFVDLSATILPNDVTDMNSTFRNCINLVIPPVIPNSVTSMNSCFYNCTNMKVAPSIPDSVIQLNYTFWYCSEMDEPPFIGNGVKYMAYTFYSCIIQRTPIIPNGVVSLSHTFKNCAYLTEVTTIPSSVENMNECFAGCTSLTNAPLLPPNVTNLNGCFINCALTTPPIISSSVTNMINCFSGCTLLTQPPVIPSGNVFISGMLSGCTSLTQAPNIPNGITDLYETFKYTNITTTPSIPDSVTNLGYAFYGCSSLTTITNLPNNVTNMQYCFSGCNSLVTIPTFPDSVLNVQECYANCENLEYRAIIPHTATTTTNCYNGVNTTKDKGSNSQCEYLVNSFTNGSILASESLLNVDTGVIYIGRYVDDLSTYLSNESPNTANTPYCILQRVGSSSESVMLKNALLSNLSKYVDLHYMNIDYSAVTSIDNLFENCTNLVYSLSFTDTYSEGGYTSMVETFKGCINLKEAPTIPSTVTNLEGAFEGCLITTPPAIPSGVTNMKNTFYDCTNLTSAPTLPSGLLNMEGTFQYCFNLTTAPTIPATVTNLKYCFEGTYALTTAPSLPSGVTDLTSTFEDSGITTAPTIPSGVTRLARTFAGCANLTSVPIIPSSVTYGKYAFLNCGFLEKIEEFGITSASLDSSDFKDMFKNCSSLVQIGHKANMSDKWHVMSLNIGASTVSGKVYNSSGDATTINSTNITKTTMTLPNLTDEILFPPNSLSDADLETLIQNVLSSKYTWWKREAIDPNQKTFVLYADDPNNVITNIAGGGGTDIKVYDTLAQAEADLPNLEVGDIIGTQQGGDGAIDAVIDGDMRLVTSNAVADAIDEVETELEELSTGSAWTKVNNFDNLIYKKVGNTVFLHLSSSGVKFPSSGGSLTITATSSVISLPSEIRPKNIVNVAMLDNTYDNVYHGRINTNGSIVAWDNAARNVNQINSWQFDICYRID